MLIGVIMFFKSESRNRSWGENMFLDLVACKSVLNLGIGTGFLGPWKRIGF